MDSALGYMKIYDSFFEVKIVHSFESWMDFNLKDLFVSVPMIAPLLHLLPTTYYDPEAPEAIKFWLGK
jgi:hypothetical protein